MASVGATIRLRHQEQSPSILLEINSADQKIPKEICNW